MHGRKMKNAAVVNHAAPLNGSYAASEGDGDAYPDKKSDLLVASYHSEGHHSGHDDMHLQIYNPQGFAFSGMYDDVSFPVTTLFCPPHPPGELPPRVQLAPRPGPVWINDIDAAGETEHKAQTTVSRVWRGILSRRDLSNCRTYEHILNYRARMIQCWWRSVTARIRHRKLAALKEEWWAGRGVSYIAERKKNLEMALTWQRRRFEGAAIKLQRTVRWFLRQQERANCKMERIPEEEWPEALDFPANPPLRPYFPWRRRRVTAQRQSVCAGEDGEGTVAKEEPRRRTILEFKKSKEPAVPPEQKVVEDENSKMRHRNRERTKSLAAPEAQSRQEWKREGLRREDLDFNAGVVQRAILAKRSASKVRTAELTQNYMNGVARIICRSFRIYTLVQRLKALRHSRERQVRDRLNRYSKLKIAEINHKLVWGKGLLDACATTIQRCWHWYRFNRFGVLPLRIRNELERRRTLKERKAEEEERARRERAEMLARLQSELGVEAPPAPASPTEQKRLSGSSQPAEAEAEAEAEEQPVAEEQAVSPASTGAEEKPAEEDVEEEEEGEYTYEDPQPPCYNLIDDFLAREEELRDAMMNLLERNKKEMTKRRKYTRFVPEKVIERKHVGVFIKN